MAKTGSNWKSILFVIVLFVAFVMLGFGLVIYGDTLTKWWIPVVPTLSFAAVTTPFFIARWHVLTDSQNVVCNGLCHLFVTFSLAYFLFLGSNYYFADDSTLTVEKAEVVAKYSKQHIRYRRVGRNRRIPDGYYYTYHINLKFPDGREKEQSVSLNSYNKIKTGTLRDIKIEKGLFGLSVIKQ